MTNLITTILGVFGYIFIGYLFRKIDIISIKFFKFYNLISFNFLLPIALITNFWNITFPELIYYELMIAFFGAGILIFIAGFFISKKFFYFKTD